MSTSELNKQVLEQTSEQPANLKSIKESAEVDYTAPVCAVGDKDCVNRWISAFSDCD